MGSAREHQDGATAELFTAQLAALEETILRANRPGNLDGLLAHHILGERHVAFRWDVNPMAPEWLADNEHRFAHAHGLAVLGFGLTAFPTASSQLARQHLADGLLTLMRKDPFQADDGVTFVNDCAQVVGLALAVNVAGDDHPRARSWLADILRDPRLRPASPVLEIFQEHARHLVDATTGFSVDIRAVDDPVALAGLHWLASSARGLSGQVSEELRAMQSRVLSEIVLGRFGQVSVPRAALLLEAATHIVTTTVDELVMGRNHAGLLLSRFEDAMRQWRYDGDNLEHPIKWPITSEREVQNILWIMLRPVFNDLVDEETLRKVGHSTYRADFGIPSLGLLIEVKYARKAADFKTFEKEISEDYVAYFAGNGPYRKMLVFIYDESVSVQEHGTTRNALLRMDDIVDVIIACRPSHLPPVERTPRRRRRSP